MDYKKIVMEIANKVGFEFEETTDEVVVAEIKLKDGVIVYSVSDLDLGIQIYKDETMTELLEDGKYITDGDIEFEIIDSVVGVIGEDETDETEDETDEEILEVDEAKDETIEPESNEDEVMVSYSELVDGTKIYYDDMVSGSTIYIDEAKETVIEDGEYTTIDGEILIVVSGNITEIKSLIDENDELKKVITDMEVELKDLTYLKDTILELEKKVELFSKNEIKLKADLDKKPAVDSILELEKDDIIIETINDKKSNREFTKQFLRNLRK